MALAVDRLSVGPLGTNCYIIWCARTMEGVVIDPGYESQRVLARITDLRLTVKAVLLTHGHFDHVTEAEALAQVTQAPVFINTADESLSKFSGQLSPLADGQVVCFGDEHLAVICTPGHTQGSICLYASEASVLFSGDTLFNGGIGRTDLPGGSYQQIIDSIRRRILVLPAETVVYPGHGPDTTVAEEAMSF